MKVAVKLVNENLAYARGGEVVLYKRGDSARWQARYKLKDLKWHRTATKHVNLQYAAQVACEAYDGVRFLFGGLKFKARCALNLKPPNLKSEKIKKRIYQTRDEAK